jgi:hypothetical protein
MSTKHPRPTDVAPNSPASTSATWPVRRRILILATLLGCVGFLLGQLWGRHEARQHPAGPPTEGSESRSPRRELVAGPWGTLELVPIEIERPDAFINASLGGDPTPRWLFSGATPEQVEVLFQQPDLTPTQQAVLLDKSRWLPGTNGVVVRPRRDLIHELSPAARGRLYSVLGTNTENAPQCWPITRRKAGVEEWLGRSGMSEGASQMVRGLLYEQGTMVAFADTDTVISKLPNSRDRFRLLKTMSRQPTVLAKLRIREGQDVAPLVTYWGRGGRAKDVQPLLESLTRVQGGALLDIAHLMPPLPRMKIYTYPFPSDDPLVSRRDCVWTALNFFAEEPDDRLLDRMVADHVIHKDYYPVQDEPQFGDIACFFTHGEGRPIHAAVYLAADLLFTKNGATFHAPWILMRLDDVMAAYTTAEPPRVQLYRHKRD